MFSSTGTAPNCRDGNCVQCPGYEFTMSADLPYECTHYCHTEPPPCLDDAESLDDFPTSEENRGDAIRHERTDA